MLEVTRTQQLHVEQRTDKRSCITADDANDKVHATSLALATHDAVGNIANDDACDDGPRRELCQMV